LSRQTTRRLVVADEAEQQEFAKRSLTVTTPPAYVNIYAYMRITRPHIGHGRAASINKTQYCCSIFFRSKVSSAKKRDRFTYTVISVTSITSTSVLRSGLSVIYVFNYYRHAPTFYEFSFLFDFRRIKNGSY